MRKDGVFLVGEISFESSTDLAAWRKRRLGGPQPFDDVLRRTLEEYELCFGSRATVATLLDALKRRRKAGELDVLQRTSKKNGTVSLRGYLPDWDAFSELFEACARALASLSTFDASGWIVFSGDFDLLDPVVCDRLETTSDGVTLASFHPDDGTEDDFRVVMRGVEDDDLEAIRTEHAEWLLAHEASTRQQRWAGRFGYLRPDGTWLVEPRFGAAHPYHAGRAAFRSDRHLWGYLDESGAVAIEARFLNAGDFQEDVARVRIETDRRALSEHSAKVTWKYGFVGVDGAWRIEPRFDEAEHFFESRAAVKIGDARGYVDADGEPVGEHRWKQTFQFSEGRALVSERGRFDPVPSYGFVDLNGELVIGLELVSAGHFRDGLAQAYRDGAWGFIAPDGSWVIEPKYERAGELSNDRAIVISKGKGGVIDREGRWVIEPRFDHIEAHDDVFQVAEGKRYGYRSRDGDELISTEQHDMRRVRHGLVPAKSGKQWGYLGLDGEWVIEPRYADAFEAGAEQMIVCVEEERWAIIDRTGTSLVEHEGWITGASHFADNGVAYLARQASFGLVREDGTVLIEPGSLEHILSFGASVLCVGFWK